MRAQRSIWMALMAAVLLGLAVAPAAVADEWINLFDKETLFGWTVLGDGQWNVSKENLSCRSGSGGWIATTSQFGDFELVTRIQVTKGGSTGIVFRGGLEGHWTENGSSVILLSEPKDSKPDWREVRVVANGDDVQATVDGEAVEVLGGGRKCGYIGFQFHRTLIVYGASTGTMPTGLALLRVIDPDFVTPAASDYMFSCGITFVMAIPFIVAINLPAYAHTTGNMLYFWAAVGVSAVYLIVVTILYGLLSRKKAIARPSRIWLGHKEN